MISNAVSDPAAPGNKVGVLAAETHEECWVSHHGACMLTQSANAQIAEHACIALGEVLLSMKGAHSDVVTTTLIEASHDARPGIRGVVCRSLLEYAASGQTLPQNALDRLVALRDDTRLGVVLGTEQWTFRRTVTHDVETAK
jgi:hypothetical protein